MISARLSLIAVIMVLVQTCFFDAGFCQTASEQKSDSDRSSGSKIDALIAEQNWSLVSLFAEHRYSIDLTKRSLRVSMERELAGSSQYGVLSRDGSQIAFVNCLVRNGSNEEEKGGTCHGNILNLGIYDSRRSTTRVLANLGSPSSICWSPDGEKLALTTVLRDELNSSRTAFVVLDIPSGKTEIIAGMNSFATNQCWSPDGSKIAYTTNMAGGKRTVSTYDLSTKQSRSLTSGGYAAWIPNSDSISFQECSPRLDDCIYYAQQSDGASRRQLFEDHRATTPLSWSPDGQFCAYVSPTRDAEPKSVQWRLRVRAIGGALNGTETWVANLNETDPIWFQWLSVPNPQTSPH